MATIRKVLVTDGQGGYTSYNGYSLYKQLRRFMPEGELFIDYSRKDRNAPYYDLHCRFTPADGMVAGSKTIDVPVEIVGECKDEPAQIEILWETRGGTGRGQGRKPSEPSAAISAALDKLEATIRAAISRQDIGQEEAQALFMRLDKLAETFSDKGARG